MSDRIFHEVPLITQGLQECVQASAAQLLAFYQANKTLEAVKKEVPVYVTPEGKPLGTSLGHVASYFLTLGFSTTIHTTEIQIFDPSWVNKSNEELIDLLKQRRQYAKHPNYGEDAMDAIFDGYITFLKNGGNITFPVIDVQYLTQLLHEGPIFAVVSYNFLNQVAKFVFSPEQNTYIPDAVKGHPATHAVVINGYENGQFHLVDPDKDHGGHKWINPSHLIGALYLAQTDFDNLLITLESKSSK